MNTGNDSSFYSKMKRAGLAVALVASVMTSVGLAPASAADQRGKHDGAGDNGKHLGWYKNGKADDPNGETRAERKARKGQTRSITPTQQTANGTYSGRYGTTTTRPLGRRSSTAGRVYDYRNTTVDPYATYPNYSRNGAYNNGGYYNNGTTYYPNSGYYNGGSYPNSGYYNNGGGYYNNGGYQPYYDNRRGNKSPQDVAERASQQGYYDGFYRGQYDLQQGVRRPNPQGHGAFQNGFNGWDPEWGSAQTYQQTYRQYFLQGYQAGYGRGSFDNRYRRRY